MYPTTDLAQAPDVTKIIASTDFKLVATIIIIASTVLMFLIIGLSVLKAMKRGLVKSAFYAGINLMSFVTAVLLTMPLSWLISLGFGALGKTIFLHIANPDSSLVKSFESTPELLDMVSSIPGLMMCALTMVIIFFISKLIGDIVLTSI
ncbi:MAG: hypothetical protein II748_06870, partial [Clostridia bacterium]|nr:hypothetical protein [Clostridia bacterium]